MGWGWLLVPLGMARMAYWVLVLPVLWFGADLVAAGVHLVLGDDIE